MKTKSMIFIAAILINSACGNQNHSSRTSVDAANSELPTYKKIIKFEELKKEDFDPKGNYIYMYGATWCGACAALKPKIEEIAKESEGFDDFRVIYVDTDLHSSLAAKQNISRIPVVKVYSDAKTVDSQTAGHGAIDVSRIRKILNRFRLPRFRK